MRIMMNKLALSLAWNDSFANCITVTTVVVCLFQDTSLRYYCCENVAKSYSAYNFTSQSLSLSFHILPAHCKLTSRNAKLGSHKNNANVFCLFRWEKPRILWEIFMRNHSEKSQPILVRLLPRSIEMIIKVIIQMKICTDFRRTVLPPLSVTHTPLQQAGYVVTIGKSHKHILKQCNNNNTTIIETLSVSQSVGQLLLFELCNIYSLNFH